MNAAVKPDEITGKAFTPPALPVCPYCGADPALLSGVVTRLGGHMAIVFFCENKSCRKIHGVAPVSVPQMPASQGLWTPGGRL